MPLDWPLRTRRAITIGYLTAASTAHLDSKARAVVHVQVMCTDANTGLGRH
jgi:hypothetical protein